MSLLCGSIDLEEAKQLEAAMFGVAYEAPATRQPIDPSQPLPFVDMNASEDVLRSRFEKYEQGAAFQGSEIRSKKRESFEEHESYWRRRGRSKEEETRRSGKAH